MPKKFINNLDDLNSDSDCEKDKKEKRERNIKKIAWVMQTHYY